MENTSARSMYFIDIGLSTENFMNSPMAGRILVGEPGADAPRVLVDNQNLPDGIDYSKAAGRLFWTTMGLPPLPDGALYSCDLDGKDIKTLVPRNSKLHTPKQIIVDHEGSKLYVCDREGLKVIRCNFDGSDFEVVVESGNPGIKEEKADETRWCIGVSVCHKTGKIYWSQKGAPKSGKGRIFRANIDFLPGETAKNRTDVECVLQNLPEPIDLAVDSENGYLYWTDRGELPVGNSINRVSFEKLKVIPAGAKLVSWPLRDYEMIVRNMHEAIGIVLDVPNKHIYATDLGGRVYRFDLDGRNKEIFYENHGAYGGITVA